MLVKFQKKKKKKKHKMQEKTMLLGPQDLKGNQSRSKAMTQPKTKHTSSLLFRCCRLCENIS
jgi:hypothetical protein